MNEFEPIDHIEVDEESAFLLDDIARNDGNIGPQTLARLVTAKSDFASFLRDANLDGDPDAIAIRNLIEDPTEVSELAAPQELRLLLDSFLSCAAAMPGFQALDEAMGSILSELTEKLNFEFATISLVDEYRDCIETVRGRNISPGWIMRAKRPLSAIDIQTHIVNTGETKVIVGWDDLLDKEIYDRFEHWRLARVWAPILSADQKVVGTIEAGCDKDRKEEVFTDSAIERVKQLGREKGDEIARKRPHILLQRIAEYAIRLIGADSASLHVYRRKPESSEGKGDDWGEQILATGAGEATPEFVKSYTPRPEGRGRKAARTGDTEWVDDPTQFEADYPKLYARGVRAVAVIPLKLGPDRAGILRIHFWESGKFWRSGKKVTPRELNLAETFAREMEVVIQNLLLFRRAIEIDGRAWALSGLQSLMQSLTSPFNLPDVLKKVAKNALLTLDANNVMVYQYHAENNSFDMPPVMDGHFSDPSSMEEKITDDMLFRFIKGRASAFIGNADGHPVLGAPSESGKPRFIDREEVKSCAVLVLRPGEMDKTVGLIFVNFRKPHDFTPEEKRVMSALARSAALAIRNARLHKDDLTRQLQAMHRVHAAIAEKGPDLKHMLERLLQQTLELTGAKYGVCMAYDGHTDVLEPIARWPLPEDRPVELQKSGEGIVRLAAQSKKSILVEDVADKKKSTFVETVGEVFPAEAYNKVHPDTRCELAVPLLDDGELLGVLNIEHLQPRGLSEDDKALLETLAVPAIIAFHTVDLYKQLGRRIKHLSALNLIAARVQEKPYKLGTIIRLFLTGITAGGGLGFSRAMLFLADPKDGALRGQSAIGAVSRQEAEEVWKKLDDMGPSPARDLDSLLRRTKEFREEIREGRVVDYPPLSRKLQEISINIESAIGAVARCLETGKSVVVAFDEPDPLRDTIRGLTEPGELNHAFACVPLLGEQKKPIGVLVVDNRFLPTERGIDKEDIAGLEAFAGLLALSIENVRLQDDLAEEKRIENWKVVTKFITNAVGTALFDVKGDVKNLRGDLYALPNVAGGEKLGALVDELNNGISRAERVLFDLQKLC